ncbi:MAG: TetR/AcrR family transcriptional regulator [Leptolinea sp.]|jgi:AcrR family transcriptional regulator|nr:TetR/AcrR family transcriptional regulator [Leptolinea sp.]
MWGTAGTDRRVLRTREAIRDAMIDLIEERGFEAISIKDIADRANINRGTFYLHFHDKYDLLDQTEKEIIENLREILKDAGGLNIDAYSQSDEPIPVMVSLFVYIKEQSRLMHAILGLKANPNFQNRVKTAIEKNIFDWGIFTQKKMADLLVPGEYLVAYVAAAHMGVMQAWLERGCRESPEQMARILACMSFHGPFHAFK